MENTIYTKDNCINCELVKNLLLTRNSLERYNFINLDQLSAEEKQTALTKISFEHGVVPRQAPVVIDNGVFVETQAFIEKLRTNWITIGDEQ
jgi:glutaredoxin